MVEDEQRNEGCVIGNFLCFVNNNFSLYSQYYTLQQEKTSLCENIRNFRRRLLQYEYRQSFIGSFSKNFYCSLVNRIGL